MAEVGRAVVSAAMAALWVVLAVKLINNYTTRTRDDDNNNYQYRSNAREAESSSGFWKGFPGKWFNRKKLRCRGRPGDPSKPSKGEQLDGLPSTSGEAEAGAYDKARARVFKDAKWEDAAKEVRVVLQLAEGGHEEQALWQLSLERGPSSILKVDVSDALKLREAGSNKAVKLTAGGQFWELQFPSSGAMKGFVADFNEKFELNKPRLLRQRVH